MNHDRRTATPGIAAPVSPATLEARRARLGKAMAAMLAEQAADTTPDITERLRFGREQALARAQAARRQTAGAVVAQGRAAALTAGGGDSPSFWFRLASALPIVLLAAGLLGIGELQDTLQVHAAAEVDAALLADDLPPEAYTDPGFQAFLKSGRNL